MKDFRFEASRFEDLDILTAARLEAEDALRYYKKHGRWPALLSKRALAFLEDSGCLSADEKGTKSDSFEVFHAKDFPDLGLEEGWYWRPCFGCLPGDKPVGPFTTAEEAASYARNE